MPLRARSAVLVLAVLLAVCASTACAAVIHVRSTGDDTNDGLTWQTAKRTIQASLDAAQSGDEVWVQAGLYVQCITLKNAVGLYGGFSGSESERAQRDLKANITIVDGGYAGSVVTVPIKVSPSTVIDGFRIQNGVGTPGTYGSTNGGGIYSADGSPTISHNTITGNTAIAASSGSGYGGGIYCSGGSPLISNNTITGNTAIGSVGSKTVSGGCGGGMYCGGGSPTIANNNINGNTAKTSGGSAAFGGGICTECSPVITNNLITNNTTTGQYSAYALGGGICCYNGSPVISNNTIAANITNNEPYYSTYGCYGGGIYCQSNTALSIQNNIVSFNSSGIYVNAAASTVRTNCVYGNGSSNYNGISSGTGDVNIDPLFIDMLAGNYRLLSRSLCIDAGDSGAVGLDWMDMDGQCRISGGSVDIGAYEVQAAAVVVPAPVCVPDGGTYTTSLSVAVSCYLPGATIHYTTNGADPAESDPVMASGGMVPVANDTTLKARAWKDGATASSVKSASYVFKAAEPVFSPFPSAYYTSPQSVTVTCATAGAVIHYTTNGADPTEDDPVITPGFKLAVNANTTIKARAWVTGWPPSAVTSGSYTLYCATPTFTPNGGTYATAQDVVVDCSSPDAVLHFTTNGKTPTESDPIVASGSALHIDRSLPLIAKAWKSGWNAGTEKSAEYIISGTNKVIYVKPDGGDARDGLNWETAKKTVQAGISACVAGMEVWAASGTYVENLTLQKGVSLYGGFGGTEASKGERHPLTNRTILDGNQVGSVVTAPSGITTSTVIDGFFIQNGKASSGGGIYCSSSSPIISGNTISSNTASNGGGIYSSGGSPVISNNTITSNTTSSSGAGIYCYSGSPSILSNIIASNVASSSGSGTYCSSSSATISNNTVVNNTGNDGSVYCWYSSTLLSNNIIASNSSGVYAYSGTPVLRCNCIFGNTSYNYSGVSAGIGDISADPLFVNAAGADYHLQTGSACIDAGNNSAIQSGWLDIDGMPRLSGSDVDMGACEVQTAQAVSTPGLSPEGGTYSAAQSVLITCLQPGADIRYTTNGSDPTESDPAVSGPLTIDHCLTLKARAWIGGEASKVKSADYALAVATPALSPAAGSYTSPQNVSVTCATAGAVIHYTLNGVDPTEADPVITSGSTVTVNANTTVKAKAWMSGWVPSAVKSGAYSLVTPAPVPTPGSGAYDQPQDVVITCPAPDAVIYYTTNGKTPTQSDPSVASGGVVRVERSMPLKAAALRSGWSLSATAYCEYLIPGSNAILVSQSGNDANDGASWVSAKKTVKAAIDACVPGMEIWVAAGKYVENITLKNDVSLYGGFAGNETLRDQRNWAANRTVLDGNQKASVVTCPSGISAATVLDGFTIQNGSAYSGGGISCTYASPTISNNNITGNSIVSNSSSGYPLKGGGIYSYGGSPTLSNNNITGNVVPNLYGYQYTFSGGGIYCSGGMPIITNNTLVGNSAYAGGGIYCYSSLAILSNNIVALNSSGICSTGSAPALRCNCVFGNASYNYSGLTAGAGDISTDPQIVATMDGTCHIGSGSPCRNAGDNSALGLALSDIDAQARLEGDAVDIGADESYGESWALSPVVCVSTNGNDSSNGHSWVLAKKTVQSAIDASVAGGEVWVAKGTYTQCVALKSGISLYGGFAGNETTRDRRNWTTNQTVLDGGSAGSVVTIAVDASTNTVIDGFTVQNGNANGGGINCLGGSPVISHNTITGNTAAGGSSGSDGYGGGVRIAGGSPLISHNAITNNCAVSSYCSWTYGWGGGIAVLDGSPLVVGNEISNNTGNSNSSGQGNGGGICILKGSPVISGNTIKSNKAASSSSSSYATTYGGGIYCDRGSPVITGNIIASNNAGQGYSIGGGMYFAGGTSAVVSNNTITGNSSYSSGGGIAGTSASLAVSNNIIAFNSSGISGSSVACLLRCNCVYGSTSYDYTGVAAGPGDISADPLFVDKGRGDFHLASGSPCINTGDNSRVAAGSQDIDGQARICGSDVDMGADETECSPVVPTPAFTPDGGLHTPEQQVTISCYWPDAIIHYTTSGDDPTESDPVVSGPLTVDHDLTLKAKAWKDGSDPSRVKSADFRFGSLHVKPVGDDTSDGLTWTTAKRTVQAAINAAQSGVDVWVAKGTYAERIITKPGVGLYGRFAGSELSFSERPAFPRRSPDANETILDGNKGGTVVTIPAGATESTIVDGFTIRNGLSTYRGGGVYCYGGTPTISNNYIMKNIVSGSSACYGGGIYCLGGSPVILCNTIASNSANPTGSSSAYGGGIYCGFSSSPTIADNIIAGNSSTAKYCYGGGISFSGGMPRILNNTIVGNTARGGGIYGFGGSPEVSNNIVAFNSSGIQGDTMALRCNCVYGNTDYNYSALSSGAGDISADPTFVDLAKGNYRLKPNSPCINSGLNAVAGLPATDADGKDRVAGAVVDIGAYEYIAAEDLRSIAGAKKAAQNSWVEISGDVVTARLGDAFYIENDNRLTGIRVEKPGHALDRPMRARVFGKVKTSADGEAYIEASLAEQSGTETGSVAPLAVNNRILGGGPLGLQMGITGVAGINNIGLLVKTWGKVLEIENADPPAKPSWFKIDDGSGLAIKCVMPLGVDINTQSGYVFVTGISSCEMNGDKVQRLLRIRSTEDIVKAR